MIFTNETRGGLPIRKHIRLDNEAMFTKENDHNPVVAAACPACEGRGFWSNTVGYEKLDYRCPQCHGTGCVDTPSRYFSNDAPPAAVPANKNGWVTCAGCGRRFNTNYRDTWTGWRHQCGQRLTVEKQAAALPVSR